MLEFFRTNLDNLLVIGMGATVYELIHWYGLRQKMHLKKHQAMLKSPLYWAITVAMIVATPFAVLLWFSDAVSGLPYRDLLIFGAAFPALFKSVADKFASSGSVVLGDSQSSYESESDEKKLTWNDYLSAR